MTSLDKPRLLAAKEKRQRNIARNRLTKFAQFIDPNAAAWYDAPHLRYMAAFLEMVERGELHRLMIFMPPRHWKSSLGSEKFPTWYLARHPTHAVILACYGQDLANHFSGTVRKNFAENPKLHLLFEDVQLSRESAAKNDWMLEGGYRSTMRASGIDGGLTGAGANLIIVDDLIKNHGDAMSATARETRWNWYLTTLSTRAEPNCSIVVIQTRWFGDDFPERLEDLQRIEGGDPWVIVELPAFADVDDPLGRKPGEVLWPERFDVAEYEGKRASQGKFFDAMYQQKRVEDAGGQLTRAMFEHKFLKRLPEGVKWQARAYDMAISTAEVASDDPDFTASCVGAKANGNLYLGLPELKRQEWVETVNEILVNRMNETDLRLVTGKYAAETIAVQSLERMGIVMEQCPESKSDKMGRALPWINWAQTGRVYLIGKPEEWDAYLYWWTKFPFGAHDDAVDVVSNLAWLFNLTIDTAPKERMKTVMPQTMAQLLSSKTRRKREMTLNV